MTVQKTFFLSFAAEHLFTVGAKSGSTYARYV